MSESNTYKASKKVWILVCSLFAIFFIGALIAMFTYGISDARYMAWLKKNGEKVEATVARVVLDSGAHNGGNIIVTYYKYVDSNGLVYEGDCGWVFKTREDAEKRVCSKIEIYIDGRGKSIYSLKKPSDKWVIGWAIVCIVILSGLLTVITILSVKIAKEKKLKKQHPQQG